MRFTHLHLFILLITITLAHGVANEDNTQQLEAAYQKLVGTLNHKRIAHDYAKAVEKLASDDPGKVQEGLRTLAATEEPAVIPWIVPLVESDNLEVRVWAGASLQKVVSANELKRRDFARPDRIVIKPRGEGELDLRPLAYVIRGMLKKPDDGNTHSYAATMIGYLNLKQFEPDLRKLLKSRHPAVTNAATFAMEIIGAGVGFSKQELAEAGRVGESFGELFRKDDEDNLGLLLLPKDMIGDVLNAKVLEKTDPDTLYRKMVTGNTLRFQKFRSMFNDLTETSIVTFQPGHFGESGFYADGIRMMKNSFVTLAYANRVEIKIKIEEMVLVDGRFYIVEID